MGQGIVAGRSGTAAQTIDATQDGSGNWRLMVEALLSGVAENEVDLDHETDSVQIYGNDGTTNRAILTDSAGRVKTDATLQIADTDVSTSNPVPVQGSGADAAAIVGSAVRISGRADGTTNTVDLRLSSAGHVINHLHATATALPDQASNTQQVPIDESSNQIILPVFPYVADITAPAATEWSKLPGNASGVIIQDGGNSITVDGSVAVSDGGSSISVDDNGGSLTVDATNLDIRDLTSVSDSVSVLQATASNLNAQVVGNVAHSATDSGGPVKVGARAVAHGTDPSEASAGERSDNISNPHGIQWVIGGHPNVKRAEYRWDTTQTNDDILGAISTGTKYVITAYHLTLDEATTVGVKVRVGFGASAVPTEPADGASVTGMLLSHSGAIPGGGIQEGSGAGALAVGGDGEELRITAEAPTTGSARLVLSYYTVPA